MIPLWDGEAFNSVESAVSEKNLLQQETWGFGQVIVLVLLLLPFVSFAGTSEPPHAVYIEFVFSLPIS
jgi:hypothetical protein